MLEVIIIVMNIVINRSFVPTPQKVLNFCRYYFLFFDKFNQLQTEKSQLISCQTEFIFEVVSPFSRPQKLLIGTPFECYFDKKNRTLPLNFFKIVTDVIQQNESCDSIITK